MCGLDRVLFYDPPRIAPGSTSTPTERGPWVYGATLCYTKAFWRRNPFPPVEVGEDTRFVWASVQETRLRPDRSHGSSSAIIHAGNTSPKQTRDCRWRPYPAAAIRDRLAVERDRLRRAA